MLQYGGKDINLNLLVKSYTIEMKINNSLIQSACVHTLKKVISKLPGFIQIKKYLASLSQPKYIILYQQN